MQPLFIKRHANDINTFYMVCLVCLVCLNIVVMLRKC